MKMRLKKFKEINPIDEGEVIKENLGDIAVEKAEELPAEEAETALVPVEEETSVDDKKKKKKPKAKTEDELDALPDLATLMNVPIADLKDEFYLFQIRKLMGKLGKVVVRYNTNSKKMEKILVNASLLGIGEVLVSPVYLPDCASVVQKNKLQSLPVNSLIDFPFGESSIKSKVAEIKSSVNMGVDGINVVMPALFTNPENAKFFKKQAKKIRRAYPENAGVAINATDLTDDQIKLAVKLTDKAKLSYLTLLFGETTLPDLVTRMNFINTLKGNKKIKVLANVDTADGITELFKLGVDVILTPYADDIGAELLKRFKIKGVKLV